MSGAAAAEGEGSVGTGTEPKTLAPLEFVVFNTDVLVLVDGYSHAPVLGLVLMMTAVPPKLQLFGTGFF